MANVLAELFQNTANAIREKTGEEGTMKPAEFPEKIKNIKAEAAAVLEELNVIQNGTYIPNQADGYSKVTVKVPETVPELVSLNAVANGTYYPKQDIKIGNTYYFRDDYTQAELKALYDLSQQKSEDGTWAFLIHLHGETIGIMQMESIYAVYISAGFAWVPPEYASSYGLTGGWNWGSDITDLAPITTPSAMFTDEEMEIFAESLSHLKPLFVLPEADGFSMAQINVPSISAPVLEELNVIQNGTYESESADGYSRVTVAVPEKQPVLETLTVTENGTYTPVEADGFSEVTVAVEGASLDGAQACTLTFIGADGSVLYTKPCIGGDSSYDPYEEGKIDVPTKESTPQYAYTYSGWSLTETGEADETVLDHVTENRTVYAVFTQSERTYAARFWDGDTLMAETQVVYGTKATPPNPAKQGQIFLGWTPSDLTITKDTDFYGAWEEGVSFESGTWEQIAAIAEGGQASSVFKIGAERTITLTWSSGVTEDCVIRVAAFDADTLYDEETGEPSTKKAGLSIDVKNVINLTSTSLARYPDSNLRKAMQGVLWEALPADLRAVIKTTMVPGWEQHPYYGWEGYEKYIYDKLSPLSYRNLFGDTEDYYNTFNNYYSEPYPVYTDNASRIKTNAAGEPVGYLLSQTGSYHIERSYLSAISKAGMLTSYGSTANINFSLRFAI